MGRGESVSAGRRGGGSHAKVYAINNCGDNLMQQTFTVKGMSCGHCEMAIRRTLLALDPKAEVRIDREQESVVVNSDVARQTLAQAITDEGYTVAT